jgi:DNA replication initiation complex subunit (GINS family)
MDTKALMDVYRKEKMSPYLQDLGEDFYREVDGVMKELHSQYEDCSKKGETSKQGKVLKELENVKSVIKDLYGIRERKVVLSALNYVRREGEEMEMENLTEEERKMLDGVIDLLKKNRKVILGKANKRKVRNRRPSKKKEVKTQAESSLVTVRITKELPSIVGADGKVYGAFQEEDVVSLPDANAKALIEQGAAEEIKL